MTTSLDQYLETIESKLPTLSCDRDLVSIAPEIFKSPSSLSRLRSNREGPPHFNINSTRIIYLKKEVLDWLRSRYQKASVEKEGVSS